MPAAVGGFSFAALPVGNKNPARGHQGVLSPSSYRLGRASMRMLNMPKETDKERMARVTTQAQKRLDRFKEGGESNDVTVSQEPKVMTGPRGGRYTEDRTKDESPTGITSAKISLVLS